MVDYNIPAGLSCKGVIDYACTINGQQAFCQVIVTFPCGMRFDPQVAGSTATQMPYRYQIMHERAILEPCCYWRNLEKEPADVEDGSLNYNLDDSDIPNVFKYSVLDVTYSDWSAFMAEFIENYQVEGKSLPSNLSFSDAVGDSAIYDQLGTIVIDNPDRYVIGGWSHEETPSFIIEPRTLNTIFTTVLSGGSEEGTYVPTRCVHEDAEKWHQGLDGRPPCNGAKTSCPYYTGPKFEYINDEDMDVGKVIKGQMIQELRSRIKDWPHIQNAQSEWEETFELPYIWGRDFGDLPVVIDEILIPGDFIEYEEITLLTKVYWNTSSSSALLSKVPSEPEGTEWDGGDGPHSPPDFPTIVDNIGESAGIKLEVTFPPTPPEGLGSNLDHIRFTFSTFSNIEHTMYVAGLSRAGATIFFVNWNLISWFPDLIEQAVSDEDLTLLINDLIIRSFTEGGRSGFGSVACGSDGFWDFKQGVDLDPVTSENLVFILVQINGTWTYKVLNIEYLFYHCDIVQADFRGLLGTPQTKNLVARIANLNKAGDDPAALFYIKPQTANIPRIANVYHYYVMDKSNTRFTTGSSYAALPDLRFWGIRTKSNQDPLKGDGNPGGEDDDLVWYKFDNCNRFLVEFYDTEIQDVPPAGMDRSWDLKSIYFNISGDEGGGGSQYELEIVDEVGRIGRSLDGKLMPCNYIIVQPKDGLILPPISLATEMVVPKFGLKKFFADDSIAGVDGVDVFDQALTFFPDDDPPRQMAGYTMAAPGPLDVGIPSPHSKIVSGDQTFFTVDSVNKYSMSYMVEFSDAQGVIKGRKWVLGGGEVCDFWVRDVDIRYRWQASQKFKRLLPDYAAATSNLITGYSYPVELLDSQWADYYANQKVAGYSPACGDHDKLTGKGALYYPYDTCFLDVIAITDLGIKIIYNPINQGDYEHIDEKYRGPEKQMPVTYKHNVIGSLSRCVWEFSLGTYTRGSSVWSGYARIRGPISPYFNDFNYGLYINFGWRFPQFGNRGRDMGRIFRTAHYVEYLYIVANGTPRVAAGWLPILPYLCPSTLDEFDTARTFFDYTIGDQGDDPDIGATDYLYDTHEGHSELISITGSSEELDNYESPEEKFFFKRYVWKDIYKVHRVRDFTGYGVRWPDDGYYFNFKYPSVTWAWQEPSVDIVRQEADSTDVLDVSNVTIGLYIRKPTGGDVNHPYWIVPDMVTDRYGRPIPIHYSEGSYDLEVNDFEVSEDEEGYLYVIPPKCYFSEDLPLYFDRYSGELYSDDPVQSGSMLHAVQDLTGLLQYLSDHEIDPGNIAIIPVHDHVFGIEEGTLPETVEDLDYFINPGNLYLDTTKMYVFLAPSLEGALNPDPASFEWIGYFPSLYIDKINPKLLPKIDACFGPEGIVFPDLEFIVNFSSYPSPIYTIRESYSNVDLPIPQQEEFLTCELGSQTSSWPYTWLYYTEEDIEIGAPDPGEHDKREGQINPFVITLTLPIRVELLSISFNYSVLGRIEEDPSQPAVQMSPDMEPQITVTIKNSINNTELVVFDKPRKDLNISDNTLVKNVSLDFRGVSIDNMCDTIEIFVGLRSSITGFRLSAVKLNIGVIRSVNEEVYVLEQKYVPSLGYYKKDFLTSGKYCPTQALNYLSGLATPRDLSDPVEACGVCEFWHPGLVSLDKEILAIGRIRRHWADLFESWDVARWKNESVEDYMFFDDGPEDSEERQQQLIDDALGKYFGNEAHPFYQTTNYFLPPHHRYSLNKWGMSYSVGEAGTFTIVRTVDGDTVTLNPVSVGAAQAGWQLRGFFACLPDCCVVKPCTGLALMGIRQPHAVYNKRNQQVCNPLTGAKLDQFDLWELPSDTNRPGLYGGGMSAGFVSQSAYDDLTAFLAEMLANVVSGEEDRMERYRQNIKDYQP